MSGDLADFDASQIRYEVAVTFFRSKKCEQALLVEFRDAIDDLIANLSALLGSS